MMSCYVKPLESDHKYQIDWEKCGEECLKYQSIIVFSDEWLRNGTVDIILVLF